MFSLRSIFKSSVEQESKTKEDKFFNSVVGHKDLKKLLMRVIICKEPVHVLLDGAPGGGKTMFLLDMKEQLEGSAFLDGSKVSGPGIDQFIIENRPKYLLIDEIDKMNPKDQTHLLNIMETGILRLTKVKKGGMKEVNVKGLKIFATANMIDGMIEPLLSRFSGNTYTIPEYSDEEFSDLCHRLVSQRYKLPENVIDMLINAVKNELHTKDVRAVLDIAKLVNPKDAVEDLEWLIRTHKKYTKKE